MVSSSADGRTTNSPSDDEPHKCPQFPSSNILGMEDHGRWAKEYLKEVRYVQKIHDIYNYIYIYTQNIYTYILICYINIHIYIYIDYIVKLENKISPSHLQIEIFRASAPASLKWLETPCCPDSHGAPWGPMVLL